MLSVPMDNFLSSTERTEKNDLGLMAPYIGMSKRMAATMPTNTDGSCGESMNRATSNTQ